MIKSLIKHLIRFRLRRLPVSRSEAAFWTRTFSAYPSLFRGFGFDLRYEAEVFPGLRMKLSYRDRVQKTILARGEWDPHTGATLRALLAPGDTFIDVGANVGYFSLLTSRAVGPNGRVFAFEPSLRALGQLVDHLESNRVRNVVVSSLGLSDRRALVSFYRAEASNIGKSSLGLAEAERADSESILTTPLDEYLAGLDVIPQVIKIDIEGAELLALRGMQRLLRENQPYVLCEVIDSYLAKLNCTATEMHALMDELGYKSYIAVDKSDEAQWTLLDDWNARSGDDDILFAKRPLPATLLAEEESSRVVRAES